MKIENLENLQKINPEEFSSLQGGMDYDDNQAAKDEDEQPTDFMDIKYVRMNFLTRVFDYWYLIK